MKSHHSLFQDALSCEDALALSKSNAPIEIPDSVRQTIQNCRTFLDRKITDGGKPMYGVNTGFGSLCNTVIPNDQLTQLQINLVLSHACGMGEEVPDEIVRLMLLLKAKGLSYGKSGAQVATVERLLYLLENNALPIVYTQGSLGASGDLAPLAHLSLPLIGEGTLKVNAEIIESKNWLKNQNISAIELQAKEGLALLNGTQFMSSYAVWCVSKLSELIDWSLLIAALSLEAYDGLPDAFHPGVHSARNQQGQIQVAERMRKILNGSELIQKDKSHVQDPYSFRCIPQVVGASVDALAYVRTIVEREINAVTDNPMVFPESSEVISAGNFHGQPLALALDFLAIAAAEVGSISERRCYKLISGTRNLPAFLTANPGVNSGLMIPQYTAASIVSQNKQLCSPASIDSIDSSNGQEDHVSMGANAATKAYRVINNLESIIAIELFTAVQAFSFRTGSGKSSACIEALYKSFKTEVEYDGNDCYLHPLLKKSQEFIANHKAEQFLKLTN